MIRYMLVAFLMLVTGPALAQEKIPFCDALSREETYIGREPYRYLVQGADGWIFRSLSDFKKEIQPKEKDLARLKQLNAAFTAQGITLVPSIIPLRGMMQGNKVPAGMTDAVTLRAAYEETVETLRAAGLHVAAVDDYQGPEPFYYKRDHHWTPYGAKAMARQVAAQVKAANVTLPPKKFTTESRGTITHLGTFERLIHEKCKETVISQQIEDFTTFSPDEQADLFGDNERPKAVLLGTSNSTHDAAHANYDGFLREALSADVDNRAVSGGGPDGAMLQWLVSKDRVDHPVTLAIWEFPVHQDYYSKNFLRQAIPAIYGACADPVASATAPADQAFVDVSTGWAAKKIEGESYYFHLTFSQPHKDDFRMVTHWADGESSFFPFKRDLFYTPDGIFFVNIEDDTAPVDGVSLQMSKPPGGTVTVNVCRIKT